jgi:hypothetical protein
MTSEHAAVPKDFEQRRVSAEPESLGWRYASRDKNPVNDIMIDLATHPFD